MTEPERSPDVLHDAAPLASLMTMMLLFALALAAINIGITLSSGSLTGAAIALIAAVSSLMLIVARHLALRGRRHATVTLFTITLAVGAITAVWIEPASLPVTVLIPPLILMTTLQHLKERELGPLVVVACLISLALVVSAELAHPAFDANEPLAPAIRVIVMAGVTILLAATLWRFGSRLHATLEKLEATNAALRESEARYRAIVEDQTELICRSRSDGIVTLINETNCRYWGMRREEILGHDLRRFVHPDDVPLLNQHLASLTRESPVGTIEHRVMLSSGEVRWQQWTNRALYNGDRLVGYQSVGRDVTERRRVEEQLYRSERQFKAIAENAPDIIARYDLQFRYLYVNPAFQPATGLAPDAVLGRTHRELGVPETIASLWDARFQAAISSKSVQTVEFELNSPRGMRAYESRIVPELDPDGHVESLLAISRDITERRQQALALQDRQKLESMGVMAGGIAHEFNNLLGIMLGNAELALTDLPREAPTRISIEAIASAGRRAAALTRQILAYVGQNRLNTTLLDLNALISDMRSLLQASIVRSVSLSHRLDPDLPLIEGDMAQLRQVLLNLTINAAEAIGDGPGEVIIATGVRNVDRRFLATTFLSPDLPEGEYVTLEVIDNGSGMDADTLGRIFDPFFTTRFAGRGLGLPATLGIVRSHRGAIKVDSTPGKGTTVTILLPRFRQPVLEVPSADHDDVAHQPVHNGIVLVIDDEEGVRAVATRMLEWKGRPVLATGDVPTACQLAEQHCAQLACVLLDIVMPQQTVERTISDLRRICKAIPIVLMSGYTAEIAMRRYAGLGINGFLQKPFTAHELQDVIERALTAQETPFHDPQVLLSRRV